MHMKFSKVRADWTETAETINLIHFVHHKQ